MKLLFAFEVDAVLFPTRFVGYNTKKQGKKPGEGIVELLDEFVKPFLMKGFENEKKISEKVIDEWTKLEAIRGGTYPFKLMKKSVSKEMVDRIVKEVVQPVKGIPKDAKGRDLMIMAGKRLCLTQFIVIV